MIKYLVMDVDGTLTDGKIYIGSMGEMMKAFSVKDGYAISIMLKSLGIVPIIITARNSDIVRHRCEELGITEIYQGVENKLAMLHKVIGRENFDKCAYFGDDVLDLQCMDLVKKAGGIIGCPFDAVQEIKAIVNYACINKAGEGALREFTEWLVKPKLCEETMKKRIEDAVSYLQKLRVTEEDVGEYKVNEQFYYSVQSYMTKPEEKCKLESHRKHIDIQVMVQGKEILDIADISRLELKEQYDVQKDVLFWKIPKKMARITLSEGNYIILYPENAHRGTISITDSQRVLKIVGKLKI